ncbi:hypothetical protein ACFRJ1_01360 [Streptomyces sp. NPDC056773]|uniref:hypothetical protein n=1 Tax=unclassified Streptomyces TaxID=2593676 RepID=UPI0036A44FF8
MRATRSLRTAAVAAGVIVGLAVPAGAAFADSPTPAASPSSGTQDKAGKSETKKEAAGEQQLADGYKATLYKHVSNGPTMDLTVKGYEAEITQAKSGPLLTLKAFGKSASAQHGGYTFTLSADGKVTSKKDATTPKPKPSPDKAKVAGISVGGNTMAELSHTAADGPKAVLRVGPEDAPAGFKAGHVQATLTKKSPRFENNGQKFEIVKADSAKPQLKVTVEGRTKFYDFPAVKKGTGDKPAKPTPPKGGVKAGAEGVEDSSGHTPVIAGSAGLAAAGAAGLGFAMVRRSRPRG